MIRITLEDVKKILLFKSIRLKRYKTLCGRTNFKTIWLDPTRDILPTFIHECIHIINPTEKDEDLINDEAEKFCERLSDDEIKTILRLILFKT